LQEGIYGFEPSDAIKYNEVALKVMRQNDIKINDLFSLVLPHLKEIQIPNDPHFYPKGSKMMGLQTAASILHEL